MGTIPHEDLVTTDLHASKEAPNLFSQGGLQVWNNGTSAQPYGILDEGSPTVLRDNGERDNWHSTPYSVRYTATGAANEGGKITFDKLKANTKYGVHVRAKAASGDTARIFTTGASTNIDNETVLTAWTSLYGTFETDSTPTDVVLKLVAKADTDVAWFAKIMVVEGDVIPTFAPQAAGGAFNQIIMVDGGTIGCAGGMELQFDCTNSTLTLQGGRFHIRQSLSWGTNFAPLDVKNEQDQSASLVANFYGPDRATAFNGDSAYFKFWNDNDAGVQINTATLRWSIEDVAASASSGQLSFGINSGGFTWVADIDSEGIWTRTNKKIQSRGGPVFIQNTISDTASREVIRLFGANRASPTDNDEVYLGIRLDDSTGFQAEFARQTWIATDVTNTTKAAGYQIELMQNNTRRDYMHFSATPAADTGTIVFNEDGQDIDFRIEASGVANAFFVQGSNGKVGIGTASPDQELHIQVGSAGAVTAHVDTQLVIESSASTGINILSPDANNSQIYFGSPTTNLGAVVRWNHDALLMSIGTNKASAEVRFMYAGFAEAMRIDSNGNVGIGTTNPLAPLHILTTNPIMLRFMDSDSTGSATRGYFELLDSVQATRWRIGSVSDGHLGVRSNAADLHLGDSSSATVMALSGGDVGINETNPTISDGVGLHIGGKILRIATAKTPSSGTDTGNVGEICWDANYIYVCTASNYWERAAIAHW